MKKLRVSIFLAALTVMQLCGCGAGTEGILNSSTAKEEESAETYESVLDAAAISSLAGKDNSLDIYSAVINIPLQVEQPEGAIRGGGSEIFLGNSRAFYFKKHLFEEVENCWDEIAFVTMEGEKGSISFDRQSQLWGIGPVLGTDHYIAYDFESRKIENGSYYTFFLAETDENNEILRQIPLDFLNGEEIRLPSFFAADKSGLVHMLEYLSEQEEWHYYCVSPEGELLLDYSPAGYDIQRLVPLYDGRVAFAMETKTQKGERVDETDTVLQYMDMESGEAVTLATLEEDNTRYTLLDERTLLYANSNGVYRGDLSGEDAEPLYLWSNHGIRVSKIYAVQAVEDGRIALIYEGSGGTNYLCIEPTTEEVEILQITMAVSSAMKSVYQTAATEFNRKYPACHIEIKSDYDETALLTELIAGNGPVLVDTSLTGFDEHKKLWEPLDTVMEQLGITEELQASAMELGKIDGTFYGVVTNFWLETLVTGNRDLQEWNYDAFLQCIMENTDLEAVFDCGSGNSSWQFISDFLIHGLEDNYLLDTESGTAAFDSEEFRNVLEIASKYCVRDEAVEAGASVLEGKVLCNEVSIRKPEDLSLCRIYYGKDANYIGYPGREGSLHFLNSRSPMTVRRTASKEEKEVACAFIDFLLSYECQSQTADDRNFALSVRKDVLEEQIKGMDENTVVHDRVAGKDIRLGDNLDKETDAQVLYDLMDKARPRKYFPRELNSILSEELEQYFSGVITEDMLIEHLENRVGLYLSEQQ